MDDEVKKGMLSKIFSKETAWGVAKFFTIMLVSWAIMFPVDVYADAARSALIHSSESAPLIKSASADFSSWFDFWGFTSDDGVLSDTLASATSEYNDALLPNQGALDQAVEEESFSSTNMFSEP